MRPDTPAADHLWHHLKEQSTCQLLTRGEPDIRLVLVRGRLLTAMGSDDQERLEAFTRARTRLGLGRVSRTALEDALVLDNLVRFLASDEIPVLLSPGERITLVFHPGQTTRQLVQAAIGALQLMRELPLHSRLAPGGSTADNTLEEHMHGQVLASAGVTVAELLEQPTMTPTMAHATLGHMVRRGVLTVQAEPGHHVSELDEPEVHGGPVVLQARHHQLRTGGHAPMGMSYGAPKLQDQEIRRKLAVVNDYLRTVAYGDRPPSEEARQVVAEALTSLGQQHPRMTRELRLSSDGTLSEERMLRNLQGMPPGEQRTKLNRWATDLMDEILEVLSEHLPADDLNERLKQASGHRRTFQM